MTKVVEGANYEITMITSSEWDSRDVTIELICITIDLIDKSRVTLICIIDRRGGIVCINY